MTIRKRLLLPTVALVAVFGTACNREAPAEPVANIEAPAPAPAAAPAEATPAPVAIESPPASSEKDLPFDTKAFAGRFEGTLACADCPAIAAELELSADGTFALETRDKAGEAARQSGTWTVEDKDARLRLDPDSKREEDRLFAIVSQRELRALDATGNPIASDPGARLERSPPE